jgi:CubicO group peptidase (beta-lactamase class C family)
MALPLDAQQAPVPRTRTFSGLVAPAFPYARPAEVGLSSEKLDWLGDEIVSWAASGELVGAELLIVKDGRAVFHESYGWSDRERRLPVERNSIWWIGGASKPFVATAILLLAEEGKLSLADPVSRYIPNFAGDARTTIRNLLTHTSGFSERAGVEEDDVASLDDWVAGWAAEGPKRPFVEFYNSDFSYQALGRVVSSGSG